MKIEIKRVELPTEHENQKFLVLEGSVEGSPELTKRRVINSAALASGALLLADEVAALRADVAEYYERWMTVQADIIRLPEIVKELQVQADAIAEAKAAEVVSDLPKL